MEPNESKASDALDELLRDPEIRRGLASLLNAVPGVLERRDRNKRWLHTSTLAWSLLLVFGLLAGIFTMIYTGRLASDAAAFILGAIVGAAFAFIGDVLPGD